MKDNPCIDFLMSCISDSLGSSIDFAMSSMKTSAKEEMKEGIIELRCTCGYKDEQTERLEVSPGALCPTCGMPTGVDTEDHCKTLESPDKPIS